MSESGEEHRSPGAVLGDLASLCSWETITQKTIQPLQGAGTKQVWWPEGERGWLGAKTGGQVGGPAGMEVLGHETLLPCFMLHGEEGGTLKVSSADANPKERVSGLTNTIIDKHGKSFLIPKWMGTGNR